MKQPDFNHYTPSNIDHGISFKADDGRLETPSEKMERLHFKAQRVLSLWTDLLEGRADTLPFDNPKISGYPLPLRYCAMVFGFAIVSGIYVAIMNSWGFPRTIMWRFSIWLGIGILGVFHLEAQSHFLRRLFWPLWVGLVAAACNISVPEYLCFTVALLAWIRNDEGQPVPKNHFKVGIDLFISYGSVAACCIWPPSTLWKLIGMTMALGGLQGLLSLLYMEIKEKDE